MIKIRRCAECARWLPPKPGQEWGRCGVVRADEVTGAEWLAEIKDDDERPCLHFTDRKLDQRCQHCAHWCKQSAKGSGWGKCAVPVDVAEDGRIVQMVMTTYANHGTTCSRFRP